MGGMAGHHGNDEVDARDAGSIARHVSPARGSAARVAEPKVGAELEILVYHRRSLDPLGRGPGPSALDLLQRIAQIAPGTEVVLDHDGLPVFRRLAGGGVFGLEPGNTIEYATSPCRSFRELARETRQAFQFLALAAEDDVTFASHGSNPRDAHRTLLVERPRFAQMRRKWGSPYVRFTANCCALQPNIDIPGAIEDWRDGFRLSLALAPFASALFSNARYLGGWKAPNSIRGSMLARAYGDRVGIPEEVFSCPDPALGYALWARRKSVLWSDADVSFAAWAERRAPRDRPHQPEVDAFLSTLRPAVRPRRYLEIRCIDAQPFEHALAPVAFLWGILPDPSARAQAWLAVGDAVGCREPDPAEIGRRVIALNALEHERGGPTRFHAEATWRRLLDVASDGLRRAGETDAVAHLGAYLPFALHRERDYYQECGGASFLRKIATPTPCERFRCDGA